MFLSAAFFRLITHDKGHYHALQLVSTELITDHMIKLSEFYIHFTSYLNAPKTSLDILAS
jgi:hypothetical protein